MSANDLKPEPVRCPCVANCMLPRNAGFSLLSAVRVFANMGTGSNDYFSRIGSSPLRPGFLYAGIDAPEWIPNGAVSAQCFGGGIVCTVDMVRREVQP